MTLPVPVNPDSQIRETNTCPVAWGCLLCGLAGLVVWLVATPCLVAAVKSHGERLPITWPLRGTVLSLVIGFLAILLSHIADFQIHKVGNESQRTNHILNAGFLAGAFVVLAVLVTIVGTSASKTIEKQVWLDLAPPKRFYGQVIYSIRPESLRTAREQWKLEQKPPTNTSPAIITK
jgi:purine-cytosine permease-like protein